MSRCNSGLARWDTECSGYSGRRRSGRPGCGAVARHFLFEISELLVWGVLLLLPADGFGQVHPDSSRALTAISGLVTDPSGAIVRGAGVALVRQTDGEVVTTSVSGIYGLYRLEAGEGVYQVLVRAPGFAVFQSELVEVPGPGKHASGQIRVDALLKVAPVVEDVQVPDAVEDTTPSGRDLVLNRREVQQLPLDPVALRNVLTGLAGNPSAQIVLDGFSGATLPPRDSIREIRINQNPYSADNDTDTATGVIQVLTQPGTNQLHGELYVYGDHSSLNAANPFAEEQPRYYADGAGGELTGAIGPRTNAYARVEDLQQRTNAAVDALVLDSGLEANTALYTVPNPRTTLDAAARIDAKVSGNNTLTARYSLAKATQSNAGVGQLSLATQGWSERSFTHTLQVADTLVISPKLVEETRVQYIRTRLEQTPVSDAPAIVVQGAFIGGGNAAGAVNDHQDRVDVQGSLSVAMVQHFLNLGGRVRVARDANLSRSFFNGQFVFSSLGAYEATLSGFATGRSSAQIALAGGGASQYVVAQGDPNAAVTVADGAGFLEDNWKVRQNLMLSYGLRFETQNFIGDHADWAPRVGFSWGVGGSGKQGTGAPKYIVHGGAGVFYQRFGTDQALRVTRFDGTRQQQYVVQSPQLCLQNTGALLATSCGNFAPLSIQAGADTVYRVSSGYRAPYVIEGSAGVERQLGQHTTVRVSYLHSRGLHMRYAENANAPLPGTYSVTNPGSGTRPEGRGLNVLEYESEGVLRIRQLTTGVLVRESAFTLTGNYMLQFTNSDAEGDGTFPLNRFDMRADYGRALNDQRHVVTVNGSFNLPFGISSWAYLRAASGPPFNIVVGEDLNGDTQYNDRPAFATDQGRSSVVRTRWGIFDAQPAAGQTIIPRNYGKGPGSLTMNVEVGKAFGFGPRAKNAGSPSSSDHKYSTDLRLLALNVLNHPNLTAPVSVLESPLFGRSVGVTSGGSLSPSRCFDMQLSLKF